MPTRSRPDRTRSAGRWGPTVLGALGFLAALVLPATALAAFTGSVNTASNSIGTAATFRTYEQALAASGTRWSHLRLDETSGTTATDSATGSYTGTYDGTTGWSRATSGATGDGNSGLKLRAGNWASATSSRSQSSDLTLELWFRTSSTADSGPLMGHVSTASGAGNGNPNFLLALNSSGQLCAGGYYLLVAVAQYPKACTTTVPTAGVWHHVVAVFDKDGTNGVKVYLDCTDPSCTPAAQNATVNVSGTPTGYWRVGEMDIAAGWGLGYSGVTPDPAAVDEAAAYAVELSTARIDAHAAAASGTGTAYRDAVLADSPFLYWRLADTAALTNTTSSGSSSTGTYYGYTSGTSDFDLGADGALLGTQASGNTAVSFNGTAQLYYGRDSDGTALTNAFTVELWVRTTTTTGGVLFNIGEDRLTSSSRLGPVLYLTNSGALVWATDSGTYVTAAGPWNTGVWRHVAASVGPAGLKLYVDGELRAGRATPTSGPCSFCNNEWIRWGGDALPSDWYLSPSSDYVTATLDEASVFPTQLSDDEIRKHHAANSAAR